MFGGNILCVIQVMTIVRRQITGALSDEPLTLEQFRVKAVSQIYLNFCSSLYL